MDFSLRVRLERALTENADLHQQVTPCTHDLGIDSESYACEGTQSLSPVLSSLAQLAVYKQMESGKRERLLASAEIEGLKKYHFKEVHALQDQLLAQRAAVAKLTAQLQDALQVEDGNLNGVRYCSYWDAAITSLCTLSNAPLGMMTCQHVRH